MPERHPAAVVECGLLGLALRIAASQPLLPTLKIALARWCPDPAGAGARLDVQLALDSALTGCGDVAISASDHVLLLDGMAAIGVADAWQGSAQASVSSDYLRAPDLLREHVIEPLVLFLAGHAGRTPLHAAGIVIGELAILLAGPSGSGKSCLAMAAQDAGLAVLSDDTVYVQHQPELATWGAPGPIHLFAADAGMHQGTVRLRNGKRKLGVALHAHTGGPVRRIAWCRLTHGETPRLTRIARTEALAAFANPEPGFDLFAADIRRTGERLVARGGWQLTLGRDPAAAIDLLLRHVDMLDAGAAA